MNITSVRLKDLRDSQGLSQEAVADKIGVTRTAYVKYETGASKPVRKLQELARLFNVTTDYLLGRESESASEMTREEQRLLTDYNSLTAEGKQTLQNVLSGLKLTHSVGRQVP